MRVSPPLPLILILVFDFDFAVSVIVIIAVDVVAVATAASAADVVGRGCDGGVTANVVAAAANDDESLYF